MNRIFKTLCSPKKFIIGKNLLNNPSQFIKDFGNKCFIVCDERIVDQVKNNTVKSLEKDKIISHVERFKLECTKLEVERLCSIKKSLGSNVILGIGGGKTIDTAKAIAFYEHCPVIIMPTAASSDAPCTSLAVLYKENGEFDKYLFIPNNPDVVLVDPLVMVTAPPKLFSSGVGDALATYFEARQCFQNFGNNLTNTKPSLIGYGLSKLCYKIISENIEKAMDSIKCKSVSPAFENMLEATIYLSGIGAESGGLGAAHAISNGLSALNDLHSSQHGEKVAFGLLVQLVLENASTGEIENVIRIMKISNLPLTLEDLGYKNWNDQEIKKVASIANRPSDTMSNMFRTFEDDDIFNSIITANEMDIDEDLYCQLCCNLMTESVSCQAGHNLCKDCFHKQIETVKPECPICCIPVTTTTLCKNIYLQKHINNLKVNEKNGCKEILTIEQLKNGKHLKECKFKFVSCKYNEKCGKYRMNEIESHQDLCNYYPTKCSYCKNEFNRMNLSNHLLMDCPLVMIPCRYKEGGCNEIIPRHELSKHLTLEDNHQKYITNIINSHRTQLKSTSKQLKELRNSCEELETKLINNDYSFNGRWIIKQFSAHFDLFKENPFTNLIISPPIFLTPTKEFSLSLSADNVVNSVNCISIILSKQFQSSSTIKFSFEITNQSQTKSIKKEEKKKFSHLIGSSHSIEFPTSEIYNIHNKFIVNDQLIIKFNFKILSIQDEQQEIEENEENFNNTLITELEE
ncbi:hypothetical protein RB653_010664 [Dictyostelium firmibasis]|uniref:Uncharacterized protein n=1 Tax=Dictyostelium firmibasis TaxID=79012 RepID=A0AAN7YL96_9MYCE